MVILMLLEDLFDNRNHAKNSAAKYSKNKWWQWQQIQAPAIRN